MKLLIDLGNSALKWAIDDDGIRQRGSFDYHPQQPLEFEQQIDGLLPQAMAVFVASVASEATTARVITRLARRATAVIPLYSEATALGVTNAYTEAHTLGVDRWLALLGAWHLGLAPCVVVDAGTAVTVDALDGDGRHRGGAIFPDSVLMQQALYGYTSRIPRDAQRFERLPGTSTAACVQAGTQFAVVGAIERIAAELAASLPRPRLLLTGGASRAIHPELRGDWQSLPDLVFIGMAARAALEKCE